MLPHTHFLSGLVMGLVGYRVGILSTGFEVAIVAFLTVALDIDHFVMYYIKHRKFDPIEVWNKSVLGEEKQRSFVHKAPGFLMVLGLLFIVFFLSQSIFYIIAAAYITHILLDKIDVKANHMIKFRNFLNKNMFFLPINYLEELVLVFFIVCFWVLMTTPVK